MQRGFSLLFQDFSSVPAFRIVDAAADRRLLREVADQLESFKVVAHHFSVGIVSFHAVGEQRVLLFQEEWP
ncbi:hypothetical protein Q8A67_006744 [Cirrhinus molitorella]|uniref:Uncharacterized protein n=1 Tax=Cirrhinus molitorella TaxID=172907 RepID=A0AA88TS20_9TELE|nr:hypothetical protein Q8A67_006744 [Cirrhinus molitorella]